ncbi:MAG TPA: phosphotransferase [Solirubrobacteraceae bacterium]
MAATDVRPSTASTAPATTGGTGWLVRRALTVGALRLGEKLRPRPARAAHDVPGSPGEITEEWLTALLCADVPGARVASFTTPGGSVGTSTRVALRVTYNDAGRQAGLPTELFAKLAASYRQRMLLGGARVLDGETIFFTKLRPQFEMEAPLGYGGVVDERAWKSAVLMEDIAATKGAQFIEPIAPLTRAQVEDLVANLARMHGTMWESPDIGVLKTPRDHFNNISAFLDMEKRCEVGMQRAKSVIDTRVYGEAGRLWEGTRRALALATDELPRTLLHGDSHVGQTYVTSDGRMGWADWQVVLQGGWAYDYAYCVSSSCEPEDRRAWDRELLELYLERLGEHGGKPPAFDEAWTTYCRQLFYPYSAWAFTIGRAAYQPKMQPDEYSLAILKRMSAAIADNDAFKAIGL